MSEFSYSCAFRPFLLILVGLLGTACSTTDYSAFGPEIEADVELALASPDKGDAAFSTGRAVYWMSGKRLAVERAALVDAIRSAPYQKRDIEGWTASGSRDAEVSADVTADGMVLGSGDQVVTWPRSEVLQIKCSTGTLHIERWNWLRGNRAYYRIALIQRDGREFRLAGTKQSARIDSAWRRLEAVARRESTISILGYEKRDWPLERMREIGIDFRGVSE